MFVFVEEWFGIGSPGTFTFTFGILFTINRHNSGLFPTIIHNTSGKLTHLRWSDDVGV